MYKTGLLLFVAMVTGCHDGTVRVHSYWGTTIDRPPLGTVYDWSAGSGHLEAGQDERVAEAIQDDIERELNDMGFVKRSSAQPPDILIETHMGRGLQPSPSGPEQRATLAVRVHDAESGRLIYCASADALINPSLSPEDRRARLDRAIEELLRPLDPCHHQR